MRWCIERLPSTVQPRIPSDHLLPIGKTVGICSNKRTSSMSESVQTVQEGLQSGPPASSRDPHDRQGTGLDRPSRPRPRHSHAPLQSRLHVLQRVRRRFEARAHRDDAAAARPPGRARHHRHHHLRRRAPAPPRSRHDHRAHPQARHARRHDHQRLSADRRADQAPESRRASTTCRSRSTTSCRTRSRRRA